MGTANIYMKPSEEHLQRIRQKIDAIDSEFLRLLTDRANLVAKIAAIKATQKTPVYYRPEREAQVLRSIVDNNQSLLPDSAVAQIFRNIMTACLTLQQPLEIASNANPGSRQQCLDSLKNREKL